MSGFSLVPGFAQVPHVKISYNVGALFDIPTGAYEIGRHGEEILNGGIIGTTGIVGIGNQFKSTVMHYLSLMVLARFPEGVMSTYDTEINVTKAGLARLGVSIADLKGEDVVYQSNRWIITDKTKYFANEWYEEWKKYLENKVANAKHITRETPFIDKDGESRMMVLVPTPAEVDSFTEFETQDAANMQADNELGNSKANTLYMKMGQAKTRFLSDVPKIIANSNSPLFLSAHIGKAIPMDPNAPPIKKLQFLKNGDTLKGATEKFTFLTMNCWHCQNATPMIHDSKMGPEYPRDSDDKMRMDTDLFSVTLVNLRSKTGGSGLISQVIVSQQEGLLASLTEFHYIKTVDRYGLGGNQQNYYLELYPECKLSRSAVRGKIDKDARLRRALNITAEMCQMNQLWHKPKNDYLNCTPKELYDDLKAKGYNWDELLDTRGWWTFNNDEAVERVDGAKQFFLSTMDLLKMRKGLYHPFWMPLLPGMTERPKMPAIEPWKYPRNEWK